MSTTTTDDRDGWVARAEQHWKDFRRMYPIYTDGPRAIMSLETFDKLDDYSLTLQTGAIVGKVWRRREPYVDNERNVFYLGEYAVHPTDNTLVRVVWREIWLQQEGEPRRATAQLF